jgi:hypothetical protein
MNWNVALERLFHAFMTSDASSTSKWNKTDPVLCMITNNIGTLFAEDYEYDVLDNEDGQICATYPLKMYFLKGPKGSPAVQHSGLLREPLQHGARFGRVRTRYPMPVILFRGRNICRSSSLTMRLEALVQATHNAVRDTLGYADGSGAQTSPEQNASTSTGSDSAEMAELLQTLQSDTSTAMDKHRLADITLIRSLKVTHIADLMLENCKRVFGVSVCSSEKNDSYKRYADFKLLVLPYPGVEFFRYFNPLEPHLASALHFDWTAWPAVNRPPGSISFDHDLISSWDSISITKNYLKTMLYCLCDPSCNGLLVHCISGWDRTPLFVSLLRLSLWADGEVHPSLSADQILYLTVAYDWMMFRHQLVLRQTHSEDIFAFCFYFLDHILGPEFSISTITDRIGSSTSAATCIPAPAPTFKPTLISFVSEGTSEGPSSSSSSSRVPSSTNSIANTDSPSLSSQAFEAIKSKKTPAKSSRNTMINDHQDTEMEEAGKKSFLDGIIISSYHGNSDLVQHMEQMKLPLEDNIIRRSTDMDSDDEDWSASSENLSDDSPSSSFQPLAFGFSDSIPPSSSSSGNPPLPSTPSVNVSSSPLPQIDDELNVAHPLDPSFKSATPVVDSRMQDAKNARRKERLLAVRSAFEKHYVSTMLPYFVEKRRNAGSSIWKWLPSFSVGNSTEILKRG